jgi:hypothetical protein
MSSFPLRHAWETLKMTEDLTDAKKRLTRLFEESTPYELFLVVGESYLEELATKDHEKWFKFIEEADNISDLKMAKGREVLQRYQRLRGLI